MKPSIAANYKFYKLWKEGGFPGQCFGQAFCNHFNITNGELFYEENDQKARDLIMKLTVVGK